MMFSVIMSETPLKALPVSLMWEALAPIGWRIPTAIVMLLCYTAFFTFIAMQDSNKSRSIIISFVFALVIIIGGFYFYNALQQPEFTTRMVMQEDGSFLRQEGVPNNKYLIYFFGNFTNIISYNIYLPCNFCMIISTGSTSFWS